MSMTSVEEECRVAYIERLEITEDLMAAAEDFVENKCSWVMDLKNFTKPCRREWTCNDTMFRSDMARCTRSQATWKEDVFKRYLEIPGNDELKEVMIDTVRRGPYTATVGNQETERKFLANNSIEYQVNYAEILELTKAMRKRLGVFVEPYKICYTSHNGYSGNISTFLDYGDDLHIRKNLELRMVDPQKIAARLASDEKFDSKFDFQGMWVLTWAAEDDKGYICATDEFTARPSFSWETYDIQENAACTVREAWNHKTYRLGQRIHHKSGWNLCKVGKDRDCHTFTDTNTISIYFYHSVDRYNCKCAQVEDIDAGMMQALHGNCFRKSRTLQNHFRSFPLKVLSHVYSNYLQTEYCLAGIFEEKICDEHELEEIIKHDDLEGVNENLPIILLMEPEDFDIFDTKQKIRNGEATWRTMRDYKKGIVLDGMRRLAKMYRDAKLENEKDTRYDRLNDMQPCFVIDYVQYYQLLEQYGVDDCYRGILLNDHVRTTLELPYEHENKLGEIGCVFLRELISQNLETTHDMKIPKAILEALMHEAPIKSDFGKLWENIVTESCVLQDKTTQFRYDSIHENLNDLTFRTFLINLDEVESARLRFVHTGQTIPLSPGEVLSFSPNLNFQNNPLDLFLCQVSGKKMLKIEFIAEDIKALRHIKNITLQAKVAGP